MAVVWGIEPWIQSFRHLNEVEIGASYRLTFNEREVGDNPLFVEAVFLRAYDPAEGDLDFGYFSGWVKSITSVGRHRRLELSDELYMIHEEATIRPDGRFHHFRDWSRRFDAEHFETEYGGFESFSVVALVAPAYPGDVQSAVVSPPGVRRSSTSREDEMALSGTRPEGTRPSSPREGQMTDLYLDAPAVVEK